jgi:hypothetical protein
MLDSELEVTLLAIDRELGGGSADAYRHHLAEDAIVVVPGAVLDRDACIDSIEAAPRWDWFEISATRALQLTDRSALLNYRWTSRRGATTYAAAMSSVYVRDDDGRWRLALHQQTPDAD